MQFSKLIARMSSDKALPALYFSEREKDYPPWDEQKVPTSEVMIGQVMKARGYRTLMLGKWHLGGVGFEPTRQGFDLNVAGDATGTALSYWAPFARQRRTMPGLEDAPAGHSISVRSVTLPLTKEPSLSLRVKVPSEKDTTVPALSLDGVEVLGAVAPVEPAGACAWNAITCACR